MTKQLLLERYRYVKTIKLTSSKHTILFVNRNTGQKAVGKCQSAELMKDSKSRNVLHEASFTQALQGYRGIPHMIWCGKTKQDQIVLLVEELGDKLKDRTDLCGGKLSLKSVCMLGIEMIQIIKSIHDKGFVHSNIELQIFQFGKSQKCQSIFINDFKQCMVFRDFKTMAHILQPKEYFRSPSSIFQSSAVYQNREKSRKDDIESIILVLIFLLKGNLPWSKSFQKQSKYRSPTSQFLSQFNNPKLVCEGCPKVFFDILEDCRSLGFEQQPGYHWYILKLKSILYINGEEHDFVYDWLTNSSYLRMQKNKSSIPSINLDKDENIIKFLEQNILDQIDIDEINSKYELLSHQLNENNHKKQEILKYDPFRDKPNQEADAKALEIIQKQKSMKKSKQVPISNQNIDKKQKQKPKNSLENESKKFDIPQKSEKAQNQSAANNSILERKRINKQQCILM